MDKTTTLARAVECPQDAVFRWETRILTQKRKRRRWDSNPRITVLQTVAFGRLATPPEFGLSLYATDEQFKKICGGFLARDECGISPGRRL